jgi:[amino group carrier protein]-L-2-aminoadipate/L-glutamate 6-kinase
VTSVSGALVVKVSGKVADRYDGVAADIGRLVAAGRPVVLVHGGSAVVDEVARRIGAVPRTVVSQSGIAGRFTSASDVDTLLMACCGLVNKHLVVDLHRHGIAALGLSGVDGGLLRGTRKDTLRVQDRGKVRILHGNHSGTVEQVDAGLLRALLDRGLVPVIAPVAFSWDGAVVNVDADRIAAAIASSLPAADLVLLSDVDGLIDRTRDELVRTARLDELDDRLLPLASGRMHVKLLAAANALTHGVSRVVIASAYQDGPVTAALDGAGTHLFGRPEHGPG